MSAQVWREKNRQQHFRSDGHDKDVTLRQVGIDGALKRQLSKILAVRWPTRRGTDLYDLRKA